MSNVMLPQLSLPWHVLADHRTLLQLSRHALLTHLCSCSALVRSAATETHKPSRMTRCRRSQFYHRILVQRAIWAPPALTRFLS